MQLQDLSYKLNNEVLNLEDKKNSIELKASVEVFSLENIYTVKEGTYIHDCNVYKSNEIIWGDTEKIDGQVTLSVNDSDEGKTFKINASLDRKVRGVKLRLENLPIGKFISLISEDKEITEYGLLCNYLHHY
mgnify:CR=1 FL=1